MKIKDCHIEMLSVGATEHNLGSAIINWIKPGIHKQIGNRDGYSTAAPL